MNCTMASSSALFALVIGSSMIHVGAEGTCKTGKSATLLQKRTEERSGAVLSINLNLHIDSSCDASTPPNNGAIGDCTDALASEATCQPTCDSGYTVSGSSSCTSGVLTAATCGAPVLISQEHKCKPNVYIPTENRTCVAAVCTIGECADYIKTRSDCSQAYFNYGELNGGCGCVTDVDVDCTDSANQGLPDNEYERSIWAVRSDSCDASTHPKNGAIGSCSDTLASGSTCQPTCDSGYTISGSSSCTTGSLTAATCEADPCDASAAPVNGAVGDCTDTLASGSTCQPTCDSGYTISGSSSCTTGSLTAGTCEADPCDASAAPTNGGVGDCTDTLASGSTCQPTCDSGYTVSGSSSCTTGSLTAATCEAPTKLSDGLKCSPNSYTSSEDRVCANSICTVLECAAYIKTRSDCSQKYFNYGTANGGCGCVTDLDVDCTDSANQGSPDNEFDRDIYGIPAA